MIHSALKPFVMEDPAEASKSMNYLGFLGIAGVLAMKWFKDVKKR